MPRAARPGCGQRTPRSPILPDEAFIDPYVLIHAYVQAARRRKVEIREGADVLRIRRLGDRITGVLTERGFIAAGLVIDTTGILTGILARQAGAPIPMSPVQTQYWVTQQGDAFPQSQPMVHLSEFGFFARARARRAAVRDGRATLGRAGPACDARPGHPVR